MKLLAGTVFSLAGKYTLNSIGRSVQLLNKNFIYYPLIGASFYTGYYLYDKLRGYYLEIDHFSYFKENNLHHWSSDLKDKYNTKKVVYADTYHEDFLKTPFELEKENFEKQLNHVGLDGKKVFRRQSKDRNDENFLYGKMRNLENIVFLNDEDITKHVSNPVDLQLKLDSIIPTQFNPSNLNELFQEYHQLLDIFKFKVENLPKFRSEKDKILGLPFFAHRHRQYPVPEPGTWQYDLFEEIYGLPYFYMKDTYETQEKINKFKYHLHLHPSIIEKFDTNSDEFDQYIRTLNLQSKTEKERMTKYREEFCRNFMPLLNTLHNASLGRQVAHYILNKRRENQYEDYLHNNYSNQKEEELFRMAEEARFLDKNKTLVHTIQYSTINTGRIGIKTEELNEILNNPTKQKGKKF